MDNRPRQHRQVIGRTVLARGIEAVDGFEMGVLQMQFFDILIHQGDKLRLTAGDIVGQRDAGVVAGVDNQPRLRSRTLTRSPGFKNIRDDPSNTGLPSPRRLYPR